jgi:hypothetical protein
MGRIAKKTFRTFLRRGVDPVIREPDDLTEAAGRFRAWRSPTSRWASRGCWPAYIATTLRNLTATLRGNPIEHGNIRVIESSGQGLRWATAMRYDDLRKRDHRRKACDGVTFTGRDQPQFSDSMGGD